MPNNVCGGQWRAQNTNWRAIEYGCRTNGRLCWKRPISSCLLKALAEGETHPAALAALADRQLRATPEQLCDALGACTELKPVYRRLLKMVLEQLQFLEQQIDKLDQEMASLLHQHQDAVQRLAEVPGLGVDSAQSVPPDLVDPLPGSSLPRTRPSRHHAIQAEAHCENDPTTPKPRLSDRITESSTQPSTSAVIFDPVSGVSRPQPYPPLQ
jgi:hypothetical protein